MGPDIVFITTTTIKSSLVSCILAASGFVRMILAGVTTDGVVFTGAGVTSLLLIWLKVYTDHRASKDVIESYKERVDELTTDRDYWRAVALGEDSVSGHRDRPDGGGGVGSV